MMKNNGPLPASPVGEEWQGHESIYSLCHSERKRRIFLIINIRSFPNGQDDNQWLKKYNINETNKIISWLRRSSPTGEAGRGPYII